MNNLLPPYGGTTSGTWEVFPSSIETSTIVGFQPGPLSLQQKLCLSCITLPPHKGSLGHRP